MIADRTQATLLLTLRISAAATSELKPLEVREWNEVARWLAERNQAPEDLISVEGDRILDEWSHPRIERDRLINLLGRGQSLALLLERWLSTGMWIVGRSEPLYPQRLRQRLLESAPPVLFGFGDPRLFQNPGLALVGSRNASSEENALAAEVGKRAAAEEFNVVSGGARGIDTHSEQGAFAGEGTVVSVLGDSLIRTAQKKEYRDHLMSVNLALITPYSPEAGFSAGNAMGRNRLIYCLADAAIAVCSTLDRGGTFAGASEAIRRGWVPVWAPRSTNPQSGNDALIKLGANELPKLGEFSIQSLTEARIGNEAGTTKQASMFG